MLERRSACSVNTGREPAAKLLHTEQMSAWQRATATPAGTATLALPAALPWGARRLVSGWTAARGGG
jgi:hypothetical protein